MPAIATVAGRVDYLPEAAAMLFRFAQRMAGLCKGRQHTRAGGPGVNRRSERSLPTCGSAFQPLLARLWLHGLGSLTGTTWSRCAKEASPMPGREGWGLGASAPRDYMRQFDGDRSRRRSRHRSPGEKAREPYSNRVPTAVAQPVPITAPLTSRISMAERDANASPPAPSSNVAVIFCDPSNTPLACTGRT